jgi:hypothetical protein
MPQKEGLLRRLPGAACNGITSGVDILTFPREKQRATRAGPVIAHGGGILSDHEYTSYRQADLTVISLALCQSHQLPQGCLLPLRHQRVSSSPTRNLYNGASSVCQLMSHQPSLLTNRACYLARLLELREIEKKRVVFQDICKMSKLQLLLGGSLQMFANNPRREPRGAVPPYMIQPGQSRAVLFPGDVSPSSILSQAHQAISSGMVEAEVLRIQRGWQ